MNGSVEVPCDASSAAEAPTARCHAHASSRALSEAAQQRMLAQRGEPLFLADWLDVLMIHFEVDPGLLQRSTPFLLDLFEGRAFVSLVAFTMRRMRPRRGGWMTALMFRPIATHAFLNVRTYVRSANETGIQFLAEWLPNPSSVWLGPRLFGLPYRLGRFTRAGERVGTVSPRQVEDATTGRKLVYHHHPSRESLLRPCESGTFDEWVMERYTAFTHRRGVRRFFRVWHSPWNQTRVQLKVINRELLVEHWPWFEGARLVGANYSPGFHNVWMGRPRRIQ